MGELCATGVVSVKVEESFAGVEAGEFRVVGVKVVCEDLFLGVPSLEREDRFLGVVSFTRDDLRLVFFRIC